MKALWRAFRRRRGSMEPAAEAREPDSPVLGVFCLAQRDMRPLPGNAAVRSPAVPDQGNRMVAHACARVSARFATGRRLSGSLSTPHRHAASSFRGKLHWHLAGSGARPRGEGGTESRRARRGARAAVGRGRGVLRAAHPEGLLGVAGGLVHVLNLLIGYGGIRERYEEIMSATETWSNSANADWRLTARR